jgi:tyrosine-protein kinase Etk/Wzc
MSLPLMATPSDVYAAVAESRTVAEEVIQTEGLMSYYKHKSTEKAVKEVWSHLAVSVGDEGIVTIAYEDKNPQKAASVANAFALKLDEINRRTFTSKAKNSRIFIEQRLEDSKKDLARSEEDLKKFQQENKAIAIDEQTKAAIGAAAGLQAQLVLVELELNVLKKNVEDTPEIRQLEFKRQEVLRQISKMEKGGPGKQTGLLSVPFEKVPDLALEYARLYRELKIQESIFELLTAEYEKAKIEESKDTPTIQILDRAVPPERKSKPKRSYMVAFAGGFSLIFSIFFVFFKEFLDRTREKNPQDYQRLQMVYATLSQDWRNLKRKLPFGRRSEG